VAVIGAGGRMGTTVCAAVDAADDLELVGRFDVGDDLGDLAGADVVVEFSVPDASPANVAHCVGQGVHVVVGTTGWSADRVDTLRARLGDDPSVGVLIAPNFAIGAVLMMKFAAEASKVMERAEIVELHHPAKLDAPSGTAARTAELMEGDVPIHSVRLPGIVADQEVILGDVAQTLTIRHATTDRTSFMPGVLLAIRRVADMPESPVVGLEQLLFAE
jgi:4-hydroxy-tetrahydrodipicolinate reductase